MRFISYALGIAVIAMAGFASQQPGRAHGRPEAAEGASTTVLIGDFWFCNSSFLGGTCETTIDLGDTVVWDYASGSGTAPHTTTECGTPCDSRTAAPIWDSGKAPEQWLRPGDTFAYTFDTPGTFPYLCAIHPGSMRGVIVVQGEASTPTPTPTQTPVPAVPSATPTPTSTALALGATSPPEVLPAAGTAPAGPDDGTLQWWHLVIGGTSSLLIASLMLTRLRRRSSE